MDALGEDYLRVRIRVAKNEPAFQLLRKSQVKGANEQRALVLMILNVGAAAIEFAGMNLPDLITGSKPSPLQKRVPSVEHVPQIKAKRTKSSKAKAIDVNQSFLLGLPDTEFF